MEIFTLEWLWIFLSGVVAFVVSTIGGGGGALLLLPAISALLGSQATAPVVQLANFIGRPVRLVLFWTDIDWQVVRFYLPAALLGGFLGAWLFSRLQLQWVQIILGLFLISTLFQYRFGKKKRTFQMQMTGWIPLGFGVAFLSSLTGGLGPVLNPFYLNYGLKKEPMIATKTANSFFVGIVQVGTYSFFGSLAGELWLYGIVLGLGAAVGNYIGKRLLRQMSPLQFRQAVLIIMVISGVWLLWKALM